MGARELGCDPVFAEGRPVDADPVAGFESGHAEGTYHLDRAVADRDLVGAAAEGPGDRLPEFGVPVVRVVLEAGRIGSPGNARGKGVEVGREVEPAGLGLFAPREPSVDVPLGDRSLHGTEYLFVIGDAGLRGLRSPSGPVRAYTSFTRISADRRDRRRNRENSLYPSRKK